MVRIIVAIVIAIVFACLVFGVYLGAFSGWLSGLHERLKGYRTIIFNCLVAALPSLLFVVERLEGFTPSEYLTPAGVVVYSIVVGLIGMWLRTITTGPVGSKGDAEPAPDTKAGD